LLIGGRAPQARPRQPFGVPSAGRRAGRAAAPARGLLDFSGTIRSGVGDPRQAQIGVRFRF